MDKKLVNLVVILSIITLSTSIFISLKVIANSYFTTLFSDEWTSMQFYFDRGFWKSVFYHHHGHPLVLPNLIFRVDYVLFNSSGKFRAYITAFSSLCIAFMLQKILWSEKKQNSNRNHYLYVLTILPIVSMSLWLGNQYKLVWAFGLTDYIVILSVCTAALGLIRICNDKVDNFTGIDGWVLIYLGSIMASMSFTNGILTWGIMFFGLVINSQINSKTFIYIVFGILFSYSLLKLMPGYGGHSTDKIEITNLTFIKNAVIICLSVLGSSLSHSLSSLPDTYFATNKLEFSILVGAAGIFVVLAVLMTTYLKTQKLSITTQALTLIALLIIISAALVGIGRSKYGIEVGLSLRYSALSSIFLTIIFVLFTNSILEINERTLHYSMSSQILLSVSIFLFSALILFTNYLLIPNFKTWKTNSNFAALNLLVSPQNAEDDMKRYYLHTHLVYAVADQFRLKNKNIYRLDLDKYVGQTLPKQYEFPKHRVSCDGQYYIHEDIYSRFSGFIDIQEKVSHMFIVNHVTKKIIGLGLPNSQTPNFAHNIVTNNSNPPLKNLLRALPNLNDIILNSRYTGWTGITTKSLNNEEKVDIYVILKDGNSCRLNHH